MFFLSVVKRIKSAIRSRRKWIRVVRVDLWSVPSILIHIYIYRVEIRRTTLQRLNTQYVRVYFHMLRWHSLIYYVYNRS